MKKHPLIGKVKLAKIYFLRPDTKIDPETITEESPVGIETKEEKGYLKMKNYKWTFYGLTRTKARYSNAETRTAFLLNPLQSSPIIAAIKYLMPESIRTIKAFDHPKEVELIQKWKLKLALLSSSKTPTLKEKLFRIQKGNCYLCGGIIDPDYLHYDSVHIHHIKPIKNQGSKFALKNLALTHIWCHRKHEH